MPIGDGAPAPAACYHASLLFACSHSVLDVCSAKHNRKALIQRVSVEVLPNKNFEEACIPVGSLSGSAFTDYKQGHTACAHGKPFRVEV